jgi:cytochrome b
LSDLHAALAWLISVLVIGHWGGVALSSWQHRENLVAAMITGEKRPADRTDIA